MLNPPSRPRAPSAATLRFLYQLAYISSGTALGVGALCAEERRRRTKVIQRIAENARRLRQSPRYNHNTAAAIAIGDDGAFGLRDLESDGQYGATTSYELPSTIERGYDHVGRGCATSTKRARTRKLEPQNASIVETPIEDRSGLAKVKTTTVQPFPSPALGRTGSIRKQNPIEQGIRSSTRIARPQLTFITRQHWTQSSHDVQQMSPEDNELLQRQLAQDVRRFLDVASKPPEVSGLSIETADEIASSLLTLAEPGDNLRTTTALVLWKIAVGRASDRQIAVLSKVYVAFMKRQVPWDIRKPDGSSCEGLLLRDQRLPGVPANRSSSIKSAALTPGLPRALTAAFWDKSHLAWARSSKEISQQVADLCTDLADSGHIGAAVHIFTALPLPVWQATGHEQLVTTLFELAVKDDARTLCNRILRWTGGALIHDLLPAKLVAAHIDNCITTSSHTYLRGLFTDSAYDIEQNISLLSGTTSLFDMHTIGRLCTVFREKASTHHLLQLCLARLSEVESARYTDRLFMQRISSLSLDWKTKRNFAVTHQRYRRLVDSADDTHDIGVLCSLHATMIKIASSAGRKLEAREALAAYPDQAAHVDRQLLTMLTLASENDWIQLEQLLTSDLSDASVSPHIDVVKQILSQYMRDNDSAPSILAFAVSLHEKLSIAPDISSHILLLQHFAKQQDSACIKEWLKETVDHSWEFQITGSVVAAILRSYTTWSRIDYSMINGSAYNLCRQAPELYNDDLKSVVKDSVTAHIAGRGHVRTMLQRNEAKLFLQELENSDAQQFPRPGSMAYKSVHLEQPTPDPSAAALAEVISGTLEVALPDHDAYLECGGQQQRSATDDDTTTSFDPTLKAEYDNTLGHVDRKQSSVADDDTSSSFASMSWADEMESTNFDVGLSSIRTLLEPEPGRAGSKSSVEGEKRRQHRLLAVQQVISDMLAALRQRRYDEVLDLYKDAIASRAKSHAVHLLSIGVSASLRRYKDPSHAVGLIREAQADGINTASAMAPLLMHRVQNMAITRENVAQILEDVQSYYALCQDMDMPASPYLASMVADTFLQYGFHKEAHALLASIRVAHYKTFGTPGVGGHTLWIKIYLARGHWQAICSVVHDALRSNRRIDQVFIMTVRLAEKRPWQLVGSRRALLSGFAQDRIKAARQELIQRKVEQQAQSSQFLSELVGWLLYHHRGNQRRHRKAQEAQ